MVRNERRSRTFALKGDVSKEAGGSVDVNTGAPVRWMRSSTMSSFPSPTMPPCPETCPSTSLNTNPGPMLLRETIAPSPLNIEASRPTTEPVTPVNSRPCSLPSPKESACKSKGTC